MILFVCSVMVVVACMTMWNQFQIQHITSNIKGITEKRDIKDEVNPIIWTIVKKLIEQLLFMQEVSFLGAET